ncbi:cysteine hydrolase family protein [Xanthobacter sp. TB0139]|uniref:cysteine hydrolase family protein n=1 Tax=Xanthobacter sp. TB0139 TaxID=3459178 RepID=UPI0040392DF2
MMSGYLVGVIALVAVVWLAQGVWRIGAVSYGKPIGDRSGTALLLVDLQSVFWDRGPYAAASKSAAKAVILREIDAARAQGVPIVALRQEWSIPSTKAIARMTMNGQAVAGTAGTELAEPFAGLADHILVKRVQDAFETGELDVLFQELGVGSLRIVGLDLNYCVQKTALAARNRGYGVTVVREGILSAASTKGAELRMAANGAVLE